jgi:hypothetical protein
MRTVSWRPSAPAAAKLFVTGATVGPLVDSLHNQCLLEYHIAPVTVEWPSALSTTLDGSLLASSWTVPPLLGIAYLVLGGILPRLFQLLIDATRTTKSTGEKNEALTDISQSAITSGSSSSSSSSTSSKSASSALRTRAVVAVTTTALIIKLSEYLETHPTVTDGLPIGGSPAEQHIAVLLVAALVQWATLDGTLAALLAASITSLGGPLSELPFVANGFWEYLSQSGDYLPLEHVSVGSNVLQFLLGDNYQHLALSSITGPCYFAVTMDAIALGRWFDTSAGQEQEDALTTVRRFDSTAENDS